MYDLKSLSTTITTTKAFNVALSKILIQWKYILQSNILCYTMTVNPIIAYHMGYVAPWGIYEYNMIRLNKIRYDKPILMAKWKICHRIDEVNNKDVYKNNVIIF